MSKRELERKIAAVREQINTLKLRVTKLESCLRTLREDPDQYFQNLNTKNREYVDWKNRNVKSEKDEENKSSNEEEEEKHRATTTSSGAADNYGFFSMMMGFFHSSATSVPMWGASRSSSSSYGHTAPRYYSLYSHTSGGSVSFPSLGGIFSTISHGSSDQSLSSSNPFYQSYVQNSVSSDTCWNTSNTDTPTTSNTSSSTSSSSTTYTPALHWMSLCRLCQKICLLIPSSLFSLYTASPLIIML